MVVFGLRAVNDDDVQEFIEISNSRGSGMLERSRVFSINRGGGECIIVADMKGMDGLRILPALAMAWILVSVLMGWAWYVWVLGMPFMLIGLMMHPYPLAVMMEKGLKKSGYRGQVKHMWGEKLTEEMVSELWDNRRF